MKRIDLPVKGKKELYRIIPEKIIALGLNYSEHIKESVFLNTKDLEKDIPEEPILFAKTPNILIESGDNIVIPAFLREDYNFKELRVDYEAELALIIKDRCKNVPVSEALDHVLGYTCMNDISMRNMQVSDKSGWFRGKSLDTFGPVGPVLVLSEDIPDPHSLGIRCRLNGKLVQDSNTKHMIFTVAEMISFISKHFTLESGDIIMTGTPQGVGPLKHGDVVEVEIDGIGVLKNQVIEESSI
ncbi:MAG: fumarylacetoacetate hydrolase family protein [Spirochaetales bacterium]|nr:fumarylacetoacetate hydrolase family protein [Spirochaetales bacterium]